MSEENKTGPLEKIRMGEIYQELKALREEVQVLQAIVRSMVNPPGAKPQGESFKDWNDWKRRNEVTYYTTRDSSGSIPKGGTTN